MKSRKAFTLVELMAVIAIIGILMGIVTRRSVIYSLLQCA